MTYDSLTVALLSLVLLLPLGALAISYRAWRRANELGVRVTELETDLAFWRETGGHVLAGAARDIQQPDGAAAPAADVVGDDPLPAHTALPSPEARDAP